MELSHRLFSPMSAAEAKLCTTSRSSACRIPESVLVIYSDYVRKRTRKSYAEISCLSRESFRDYLLDAAPIFSHTLGCDESELRFLLFGAALGGAFQFLLNLVERLFRK